MKNLNNFVENYIEILSKSILSTNITNLEKSCKEILKRMLWQFPHSNLNILNLMRKC